MCYHFKTLCLSPYFPEIAKAWTDSIDENVVRTSGGYTLDSHSQLVVFVDDADRMLGFAVYDEYTSKDKQDYIWLDFVYVLPEYRKKGIFRELVDSIKERHLSIAYIEFGTRADNHKMINASSKLNFKPDSVTMRLESTLQ